MEHHHQSRTKKDAKGLRHPCGCIFLKEPNFTHNKRHPAAHTYNHAKQQKGDQLFIFSKFNFGEKGFK